MEQFTEQKIEIHEESKDLASRLASLEQGDWVSDVNKAHIKKFIRDCSLGKTVLNKEKKKIGPKRLLKYVYVLPRISVWLGNKDFLRITETEMEDFIAKLENNHLAPISFNAKGPKRKQFSPETKRDFKVCLKKFYKWLLGSNRTYPDLVAWIDTSSQKITPPSYSLEQIKLCADFTPTVKGKALVWTLFQSSARAEEFLNIRLHHVETKDNHALVRIEFPKTFKRTNPIYEGFTYFQQWLEQHPYKHDPHAPLFPMTYDALRMFLKRLGKRVLQTNVTPHRMRNSLATWLADKRVGRYQMCKIMGWAMNSDEPDRYINRAGVVEVEAISSIRGDELQKVEQENETLSTSLKRLESQYNHLQEVVAKNQQRDDLLNQLLTDETIGKVLIKRIKEKKLGEKLLALS